MKIHWFYPRQYVAIVILVFLGGVRMFSVSGADQAVAPFQGRFYSGEGDAGYLRLLDMSRRMYEADPEYPSLPMLYKPLMAWSKGRLGGHGGFRTAMVLPIAAFPFLKNL